MLFVKGTSVRYVHLPETLDAEKALKTKVRGARGRVGALASHVRPPAADPHPLACGPAQLNLVDQGKTAFAKRKPKPPPPPRPAERPAPLVSEFVTQTD